MKRLVLFCSLGLAAGAAAAVWLASASASGNAGGTICHRASSDTTPYKKITVSAQQLKTHLNHPGDIIPAPKSGCPQTLLKTTGGRAFTVAMTGEAESPAGDPVATGTATVRLRSGQGQVCYTIQTTNSEPAVASHIHVGAGGVSGPVVIPLTTPDASGKSTGCATTARPLVAAILKNPAGYYVNVHTATFPGGAIRGQLTGTSASAFGTLFAITLKGSTEPNATGTAIVRIRKDAAAVCYRLHAANVTLPTIAAHIHRGDATVNGPVVVPFTPPGPNGNSSGCVTNVDPALIDQIIATPSGFYVNVHTKEHPGGAIRAQLG
jgi:hypothetical protein